MTRSHRSKAQTASRRPGPSRRTFRPRLEELESRVVPSTSFPLSPYSWVDIGPAPISLPSNLSGPGAGFGNVSGRVTGLATDPTNAAIIYAATAGGGVWKTVTGGTSWFPTMDNLRGANGGPPLPMFMGAVALAPSNPRVVYAGSGEANNSTDSFYGVGVWVSTNGGGTWALSGPDANALRGSAVAQIAVDPLVPNTAWAAVTNTPTNGTAPLNGTGIYRTTDGGVNWTNVTATSLPSTTAGAWTAVVIDPTTSTAGGRNATLFAAVGNQSGSGSNGIYRSTNSGRTWALVNNVPSATVGGRIALALSHPSGTVNATLYASITSATVKQVSNLLAFDVSTDGGATWTKQSGTPDYTNGLGWYGNVVQADPVNTGRVYVAGAAGPPSIFESTNFGRSGSWVPLDTGTDTKNPNGPHTDHHALAIDRNFRLVDGSDGGVWRLDTNDTNTPNIAWTDLNSNLETIQFTGISLDPGNNNIVYGGSQDNGTEKFIDVGAFAANNRQWSEVNGGDGGFTRVDPNNHLTVYVTGSNVNSPFIQRSDDGGQTFTNVSGGINLANSSFYPPFVIDPNNSNRLVLGTTRLYVTADRGGNAGGDWAALGTAPSGNAINWVAIAPSDSNTIYVSAGGSLYVTTNNAKTWTTITPRAGGVVSAGPFPGIAVNPNDSRTAYVVVGAFTNGGTGEVWQTTDGGANWTDITGSGLPNLPVQSITLFPPTSVVFVGTDAGVFATNQVQGASTQWVDYSGGLPNAQVVDLEPAFLSTTQPVLAAATHGRGVYEVLVPTITINSFTPPVGVLEGNAYINLPLGTFSASDPSLGAGDFTATVTWGDGSPPDTLTGGANGNGGIVDLGDGVFRLFDSHVFRKAGSLPVQVAIASNALPFLTTRAGGTAVVADAPLTVTLGSPNFVEGQSGTDTVATFSDGNAFADINDFTAYVLYGGRADAKVLTAANGGIVPFTFFGVTTFVVRDNPTFSEEGDVPFAVVVVDAGGSSDGQEGTLHVQDAPLNFLAVTPPAGLTEGDSTGLQTLATFGDTADTGLGTDINDFSAGVYWGDGTLDILTAANGGIVSESPFGFGPFDVVAEHRYTEEGTALPFTINVADVGGSRLSRTVPIDVADAPLSFDTFTPPAPPAEGFLQLGTLATFSDLGGDTSPDDFTATVDWGDGAVSTLFGPAGGPGGAGQLGIVYEDGHFVVFSTHVYDETPPDGGTFTVTVTDVGGATVTQSAPIVVADLPLTLVKPPPPLSLGEGQNSGNATLFVFSDPGFPDYETSAEFTAVVDWGDGTSDSSAVRPFGIVSVVVNPDGHSLSVVASHTYKEELTDGTLTVTVTDVGGEQISAQNTVNVDDSPLSLSFLAPPSGAVEGQDTGLRRLADLGDASAFPLLSDYQAVVSWGDGLTDTLTAANGGIVTTGATTILLGGHAYAEELTKGTFTITVTDVGGASVSQSVIVNVDDAPFKFADITPGFVGLTPAVRTFVGQPTGPRNVATWTDADANGTAGDYTVTVQWGDRSTDTLTAANGVVDNGDGTFSAIAAGHTYIGEGTFTFAVTIKDAGGAFSTASAPLVVYVPTATTLGATPNPSVAGQPVTFVATVTPGAVGQDTPTGTVTFKDGAKTLKTVPLGSAATVSLNGTLTATALMGWYKGEGTAVDSASGHNGTLQGGVTFVPGQVGQAFGFNGAAYVRVAATSALESLTPTLEAWVKATAPGAYRYIASKGANGNVAASYALYTGASGGLFFYVYNGAGAVALSPGAGPGIWDGQWHHVAGTYDGSAVRLFVDGAQVGNGTPTNLRIGYGLPTTNDFFIGAYNGIAPFPGAVDEVKFYNRALTATEVQASYNAGSAGLTSNNAVLIISTIPAGMHSITATYNGNGSFAVSTSGPPVVWPVSPATTTTALAVGPAPGEHHRAVTLTATVAVVAPGNGTPGGTVTFLDGTAVLGRAPLVHGVATFTTGPVDGRHHDYSAAYSGDHNFLPSVSGGYPFAPAESPRGTAPLVNLLAGQVLAHVTPFPGFDGPVWHAAADVNGDGLPDDVWATGAGGRPEVRVTDGRTGWALADFYAFAPSFHGGVSVAVADVNGDGAPEVIVGAGPGMRPEVKVIDGTKLGQLLADGEIAPGALLADFLPYAPSFHGGVSVAAADVNRDLAADVITAAGPGGGAEVKIVSGRKLGLVLADGEVAPPALLADFRAFDASFHGGVNVAAGDINGDGVPDVIVGEGSGGGLVRVFAGSTGRQIAGPLGSFAPFGALFDRGVWVAARDVDSDGIADVIVGADAEEGAHIKVYDGPGGEVLSDFAAPGGPGGEGRPAVTFPEGPGGAAYAPPANVGTSDDTAAGLRTLLTAGAGPAGPGGAPPRADTGVGRADGGAWSGPVWPPPARDGGATPPRDRLRAGRRAAGSDGVVVEALDRLFASDPNLDGGPFAADG